MYLKIFRTPCFYFPTLKINFYSAKFFHFVKNRCTIPRSPKPCRLLHPNFFSALKKFSALFHEENFFEGSKLPLSPMFNEISNSPKILSKKIAKISLSHPPTTCSSYEVCAGFIFDKTDSPKLRFRFI